MTKKRFRVQEHCLMSSYGIEAENWLVTNDNHSVVLNDKAEAHMVANMSNDVINEMNALHEEKESWKHKCISADNQNSMLWNEISYMREQGAKPSDAFEKYLDEISSDYDRFWRRKLKKAKELEEIVNDWKTI